MVGLHANRVGGILAYKDVLFDAISKSYQYWSQEQGVLPCGRGCELLVRVCVVSQAGTAQAGGAARRFLF